MRSKEPEDGGTQRPQRRVEGSPQVELFDVPRRDPGRPEPKGRVGFQDPSPDELVLGNSLLRDYLESAGMGWVVQFRTFLRALDWSAFEARYELTGRSPYAPVAMVGLILYGIMKGLCSLRALESLARLDVGAMYVTGGLCPDHSSLGRFLQRHEESVSETLFEDLTRQVLAALGSRSMVLAGDGTVMEAMASRLRTMKIEAARQAAQEAAEVAKASPDDEAKQAKAEAAKRVQKAAEDRAEARRRNGLKPESTQVTSTEPEAPVLKGKRGNYHPGYTPSIATNEERFIVAQHVEPCSEKAAVGPLLDQAERTTQGEANTLLLDGNYHCGPVAREAAERDIDLLAPAPKPRKNSSGPRFTKRDFEYEPEKDRFRCPNGAYLTKTSTGRDKRRRKPLTRYSSDPRVCNQCPLRSRCLFKGRRSRRLVRQADEDYLDALKMAVSNPRAQAVLKRRAGMVEPVFSELRGVQGLNRFARRGLPGVRLEFALHACAYNLRRMFLELAKRAASGLARLLRAFYCLSGALIWAFLAITPKSKSVGQSRPSIPVNAL